MGKLRNGENASYYTFLLFKQFFLKPHGRLKFGIVCYMANQVFFILLKTSCCFVTPNRLITLVVFGKFLSRIILHHITVLILSQTRPGFYVSAVQVFRKHCGKRRNYSFSHSVCYWFEELAAIFINFKIVDRKLFQLGRV